MRQNKGLTLPEVLLALALVAISMIAFLYIYRIEAKDKERKEIVFKLLFDISRIEVAFLHYYNVRNEYPRANGTDRNILNNSTDFVRFFLKEPMPEVPSSFDRSYGNRGYFLSNQTQNYYLCVKVNVNRTDDVNLLALKEIVNNFPGKAFYNNQCPSNSTADRTGDVFLTYWIVRQ